MGDLFDPFGMGSGSGVGSSGGSSRPDSGADLFGDLLGSDSNPAPAANSSLFNLSKTRPTPAAPHDVCKSSDPVTPLSTDKLVNDAPKMTSSASHPDLLGGWDSWAAGTSGGMSSAASKPTYTSTGVSLEHVFFFYHLDRVSFHQIFHE